MIKRFGLPALVSTVYLSAMILIFSTDYSKEKNFLYPTPDKDSRLLMDGKTSLTEFEKAQMDIDENAIPLEATSEPAPELEPALEIAQPQAPSPEGSDEE